MTAIKTPLLSRLVPRLSLLDRYIAGELIAPFLFGVGAFSAVLISIGAIFELVREVAESGLQVGIAVQVLVLRSPQFLVYSFPMSMLLATLMTYSRLSSDSEITALRSTGISVYRLVAPAIALSLAVTGMTFLFNELFVPAANYQAEITLDRALEREKPPFRQDNILYTEYDDIEQPDGHRQDVLVRFFYAERFDGEQMRRLTVVDRSRVGVGQIITADRATWNPRENKWDFYDGAIYLIASDSSYRDIVRFQHKTLQLPRTPFDIANRDRDYGEMNIAQALDYLERLQAGNNARKTRKLRVRINQKVAFPFICLVFGLAGAALGTSPRQTARATSFGISVMVIFGYYLLAFITGAMGQVGIFSPFLAAWIPNFLGFGIGGWLLWRSASRA